VVLVTGYSCSATYSRAAFRPVSVLHIYQILICLPRHSVPPRTLPDLTPKTASCRRSVKWMCVCVCVCACLPAYECHMAEEVEPLWTLDFGRSHKVCSRGSKTLLHQFQLSLAPNNVAMLQSKPKGTNQCG